MPIVISVDLGTTKITSLAMDAESGMVIATATVANDANVTSELDKTRGRSEWDARRIVDAGLACLKKVAEQLGEGRANAAAVAITGQQHGMVLVDRAGDPVSPLINWQDRRLLDTRPGQSGTWLDEIRSLLGDDCWKRTGCRIQPGFMAGTLVWMNAQSQLPRDCRALFIMDYFGSALTGNPATTEPSCAGSSGVLNIRSRQWDDQAIVDLRLPRDLFPDICEANQSIGRLRADVAVRCGLPEGIPVRAPIGDHQASFAGSVLDREASILINVGTGAQVAVYTATLDFAPPIELRPFPVAGNLLSNVGLAGGWSYQVLEQFFRDVGLEIFSRPSEPLYETLNRVAASIPEGADGLRCDPQFAGTRQDPGIRGTITGLSPQNFTAGHLTRAVLEGMARSLRDGYRMIESISPQDRSQLIAAGNGLRENPLLAEIVSRAFGMPLRFSNHREEAACGAALIASQFLE